MVKAKTKTAKGTPKTGNKKRRVESGKYRSFRISKRLTNTRPKLPSSWTLLKSSLKILRNNWKLFAGIALIYGLLLLFLGRGLSGGQDLVGTKALLEETLGTNNNNFTNSVALFGELLSGTQVDAAETTSIYQSIIVFLSSLAFIWSLRQVYDQKVKTKIRIRDAFYNGMYPLVPALLVLCVMSLQLIPVAISSTIYNVMIVNGLAVTLAEKVVWIVIIGLLVLLSLYMIGASLIALFAVTLPGVSPMQALRGSRKYVEHRRFSVIAKLLWLAVGLLLFIALIVLPLIAFVPVVAEFAFFVVTIFVLPFSLAYIYNLYRALLV